MGGRSLQWNSRVLLGQGWQPLRSRLERLGPHHEARARDKVTKAEELLTQAGSLRHQCAQDVVDLLKLEKEFAIAKVVD